MMPPPLGADGGARGENPPPIPGGGGGGPGKTVHELYGKTNFHQEYLAFIFSLFQSSER